MYYGSLNKPFGYIIYILYIVGHRIGFIKKAINDTKKWIERWECLIKMCPWDFPYEMEVLFPSRVESEL